MNSKLERSPINGLYFQCVLRDKRSPPLHPLYSPPPHPEDLVEYVYIATSANDRDNHLLHRRTPTEVGNWIMWKIANMTNFLWWNDDGKEGYIFSYHSHTPPSQPLYTDLFLKHLESWDDDRMSWRRFSPKEPQNYRTRRSRQHLFIPTAPPVCDSVAKLTLLRTCSKTLST